jgi:ribosome maturation factor RimP
MPAIQDNHTLERITELGEQAAANTGIEIVEVQLRGSGKARLLRVYIDKPGGVTHADCELISDGLGKLLDAEDAIPGDSYTLEVSSPGAERKLSKARDFERVIGQKVRISLREAVDGVKSCEGKLLRVENEAVEVETLPGRVLHVPLIQIQKANLKLEW